MQIQIPTEESWLEFFEKIAAAFKTKQILKSHYLGCLDSLRQAYLIPHEPLGLFSGITAEEEASTFLYYALQDKGYPLPVSYGRKLKKHQDKIKVLIGCLAIQQYFHGSTPFANAPIRILFDNGALRISTFLDIMFKDEYNQQSGVTLQITDPLSVIRTKSGEGEGQHRTTIAESVNRTFEALLPRERSIRDYIEILANRRNRCLYGHPKTKLKPNDEISMVGLEENCISMLTFGLLVFQQQQPSTSMKYLVEEIFKVLET